MIGFFNKIAERETPIHSSIKCSECGQEIESPKCPKCGASLMRKNEGTLPVNLKLSDKDDKKNDYS